MELILKTSYRKLLHHNESPFVKIVIKQLKKDESAILGEESGGHLRFVDWIKALLSNLKIRNKQIKSHAH